MAVILEILGMFGLFVTPVGIIWGLVKFVKHRNEKFNEFKEHSKDTLNLNIIKEKYNNDCMLYIDEINYRIRFHLYGKRKQLKSLINLYTLYINSTQFKYVYERYVVKENKFKNRKKINLLNLIFRPLFLKLKLKYISEDINKLSEYLDKTDKYLDQGYKSSDKFMATAGELYREFTILNEIYHNNIFVLHSHAGDGKTFISNFHAEILLNQKKLILFLDSLSIKKDLNQLIEITKNYNQLKTIKRKIFIVDGFNEFMMKEEEVTSYIYSLTKFRKRDKIIVTTRTLHYDKYFTYVPNVYDFDFKYYEFINGFGRHDSLRKNILIDLYCDYYAIERNKLGLIGDYVFTQMLLVKIYFKLLKENTKIKISDKHELFDKYLNYVRRNCSEKLGLSITIAEINKVLSSVIDLRLVANHILYSELLKKLNSREVDILEFLINEEIILRKEEQKLKGHSISDTVILFNFDDIRDHLIVNHLLYKYMDYKQLLEEYSLILKNIENLTEGTFEHLLISSCRTNQEILLNTEIDEVTNDLKIRILIKNGIFNDYLSDNLTDDFIYIYTKEITEIIIKSMFKDKVFPGNEKFQSIILKDKFGRIDMLDDYRNRLGREKIIKNILQDILENQEDYEPKDVLMFMNLMLNVKDYYEEIIELREKIIKIYGFKRGAK